MEYSRIKTSFSRLLWTTIWLLYYSLSSSTAPRIWSQSVNVKESLYLTISSFIPSSPSIFSVFRSSAKIQPSSSSKRRQVRTVVWLGPMNLLKHYSSPKWRVRVLSV
jgi:hypothetical protein